MSWLLNARYCLEVISNLRINNGHTLHALQSLPLAPGWKEGSSYTRALRLHRPSLGLLTTSPQMEGKRVLSCLRAGRFGSCSPSRTKPQAQERWAFLQADMTYKNEERLCIVLSSGGDSSLCSSDGGWSPQLSETLLLVKAGWEFERDPLLIRHYPLPPQCLPLGSLRTDRF